MHLQNVCVCSISLCKLHMHYLASDTHDLLNFLSQTSASSTSRSWVRQTRTQTNIYCTCTWVHPQVYCTHCICWATHVVRSLLENGLQQKFHVYMYVPCQRNAYSPNSHDFRGRNTRQWLIPTRDAASTGIHVICGKCVVSFPRGLVWEWD